MKNNEPFLLDLKLSAAGNDLTVKGAVTKPVDATGIDLKAALSVKDIAALGTVFDVELAKLGPIEATFTLADAGDKTYAIKALSATMPGADLGGDLILALSGHRPHLKGALTSKKIDLNKLLPANASAGKIAASKQQKKDGRIFSDAPLPFAALAAFDADLTYKAAELTRDKVHVRDINAVIKLNKGILKLAPVTARLSDAPYI